MPAAVPRPKLFVFPLQPAAVAALPASLAGSLAYYHDRPLYPHVEREIGDEPELDDATRDAVYGAIEAQVEALALEERLYRGAATKRRVPVQGFVCGPTMADIGAACERAGWTLVRPLEEPDAPPVPAPEPKPKRVKAKAPPAPAVPEDVAARIAKIEALAKKAGIALARGASWSAIAALEDKLGATLPIELRAFYLAHDGGPADRPAFGDRWLLSIDGVETYWEQWRDADEDELDEEVEPDRGVRKDWWNPKWIPVTHDAGGNHEMVDLAPAKGGKVGQIISAYHDDGGRSLQGPDFLTWLEKRFRAAAKKPAG